MPVSTASVEETRALAGRLDAYRLAGPDEAADLALDELFDDHAVTVIEWGDRLQGLLPVDRLEIAFTFGDGDDDRVLTFEAGGPGWAARLRELDPSC
jgi:tRNA threonylcarbamoyladenosine biosynthesis protein TsaE